MKRSFEKSMASMLLVLMVFTMVPMHVFAEDIQSTQTEYSSEPVQTSEGETATEPSEENEPAPVSYSVMATSLTEPTLQERIDALPDPSTVTKGDATVKAEVDSIYTEIYALRSQNLEPPDMKKLYAVAAAVYTLFERCDILPLYNEWRDYLVRYYPDRADDFKEELKAIFLEINAVPKSQRPTGNTYNKVRNQVDGFFTPQDRIDAILPSLAQIESMSDSELEYWHSEVTKTWSRVWELNSKTSLLDVDPTVLVAISRRIFSFAERIGALPYDLNWWVLPDSDSWMTYFREEVKYLYDKVFNKVPLDAGDTIPSNLDYLILAAKYCFPLDERIAYLPTVAEYEADFSDGARKTALEKELYQIYLLTNELAADDPDHPDLTPAHALRNSVLTLQERINALPPRDKVKNLTDAEQAAVADEIRALYTAVEAIGEGTYPNLTRLRETAPAVIDLQELINRLPDVDDLEDAGDKYIGYLKEETVFLRSQVKLLENAGEDLPDTTHLEEVETFLRGDYAEVILYTEQDLIDLLAEMNAGKPKVRVATLANDITITNQRSLSQGELTILGDGNAIKSNNSSLFSVSNAVLNLGSEDGTDTLTLTGSSSAFNGIQVGGSIGVLNIYEGTTLGPWSGNGYMVITSSNAVVNINGGLITGINSAGPFNVTGASYLNFYDGVIKGNNASQAGAFACTTSSLLSGGVVGDVVINMYGGTIEDNIVRAQTGGGAVSLFAQNGATFNMYGGTIQNCSTTGSANLGGGAVFMYNNSIFNMSGGTIEGCTLGSTKTYGGGAVFTYSNCTINMSDGTITGCEAKAGNQLGGAVFLYNGCAFNMTGGTISDCSAKYGGAIVSYTATSTVAITEGTIAECEATSSGGAIFVNKGTTTIGSDAVITKNSSNQGGGITAAATLIVEDGAQIHSNTAASFGNDILVTSSSAALYLGAVADGVVMDSCGHEIDGWYYDLDPRYAEGSDCYILVDPDGYAGPIGLTAGHKPVYTITYSFSLPGEDPLESTTIHDENGQDVAPEPDSSYIPDRDGYTFLGWYEKDTATGDVAEEPFDFSGSVTADTDLAAVWECDAPFVLKPQDIACYVGGSSANNGATSTLRFSIEAPADSLDLGDLNLTIYLINGKTVVSNGHEDDSAWVTAPFTISSSSNFAFPTLELGLDVATGDDLVGEFLTLKQIATANGTTQYEVVLTDTDWYLYVDDGDCDRFRVELAEGSIITVRYLSDAAEFVPVNTDPTNVESAPVAVISSSAEYYTNGKSSDLGIIGDEYTSDTPSIALVSDDILATDDVDAESALIHHATECTHTVDSFDDYNYDFRYLDLVNTADGNAWVSCNRSVTIYWPIPADIAAEGLTTQEIMDLYDFKVLHFKGVEREYTEATGDDWETEILHPEGEAVEVEDFNLAITDGGIKFTIPADADGNMSPFVLLWKESDEPAHTHTWDSGVVTVKPTATAAGQKLYTCTGCGETKIESISFNPYTGDESNTMFWVRTMMVSLAGVIILIRLGRKKEFLDETE